MPTLTIRDLASSLYKLLKERAAQNGRSVNDEVIASIKQAVDPPQLVMDIKRVRRKELLANIRRIRNQTKPFFNTLDELNSFKRAGRDRRERLHAKFND
jgi:plasmid stability protein